MRKARRTIAILLASAALRALTGGWAGDAAEAEAAACLAKARGILRERNNG